MSGYLKTCKICGKEFIAPQQKVEICYGEHTEKCIVYSGVVSMCNEVEPLLGSM